MTETASIVSVGLRWIGRLQKLFLTAALIGLAVFGYLHREAMFEAWSALRPGPVLLAGACMLGLHLFVVLSFHALHRGLGIQRPFGQGLKSYFLRLPGRFLPGGVWHSFMRYADLHSDQAASANRVGLVAATEFGVVAVTGLTLAGLFGFCVFAPRSNPYVLSALVLMAGIGLGVTFVALSCKRAAVVTRPGWFGAGVLLMAFAWIAASLTFFTLAASAPQSMLPACNVAEVTAAYLGAASLGYVAVFAPQGWGVTESVLGWISPCDASVPTLVAAVFAYRLVSLVSDAFIFLVAAGADVLGSRPIGRGTQPEARGGDSKYQHDFSLIHPEMYDRVVRERKAQTILCVLREALGGAIADARLLNIGSSSGLMDGVFASALQEVVGVDIDEQAITFARKTCRHPNLRFEVADGMALPFADKSFDVVVCSQVYEHVPDPRRLMSEIRRVLRPGGFCYFAATNRYIVVEPHYRLWFLSWLSPVWADRYLRLMRRGEHYYERMQPHAGLRRLVQDFNVTDYTVAILREPSRYAFDYLLRPGTLAQRAALLVATCLPGLCPGYVWLLYRRA